MNDTPKSTLSLNKQKQEQLNKDILSLAFLVEQYRKANKPIPANEILTTLTNTLIKAN